MFNFYVSFLNVKTGFEIIIMFGTSGTSLDSFSRRISQRKLLLVLSDKLINFTECSLAKGLTACSHREIN
jgi:hypothetical protein